MKIKTYKVDAFTNKLFSGNQAGVCILNEWIDESLMQKIANENNLSETAFVVKNNDIFDIRWFTPIAEVELCGHATLAAAFVLFNEFNHNTRTLNFNSLYSGLLSVSKTNNDLLELNFPTDTFKTYSLPNSIKKGLNILPVEVFKGKTDYMLIYKHQDEIENLQPNFDVLRKVDGRGIIVSAPGNNCDFVSRFFAPQSGINEDPVTGSAHTTLIPYWSNILKKKKLEAIQLSNRKGYLSCTYKKDRVLIAGSAIIFLKGEIEIIQ